MEKNTSSQLVFNPRSFFSASVFFLCNVLDSSRVPQVWVVRYINEKKLACTEKHLSDPTVAM